MISQQLFVPLSPKNLFSFHLNLAAILEAILLALWLMIFLHIGPSYMLNIVHRRETKSDLEVPFLNIVISMLLILSNHFPQFCFGLLTFQDLWLVISEINLGLAAVISDQVTSTLMMGLWDPLAGL
ncbi:hypothetical protein ACJX0J_031796, partial [Zea mays]